MENMSSFQFEDNKLDFWKLLNFVDFLKFDVFEEFLKF